jgi:multisubunit Na+/H+ antiporter MnhG subunit
LIIAVLSILITAPVGAILITLLGTKLLEKEQQEAVRD